MKSAYASLNRGRIHAQTERGEKVFGLAEAGTGTGRARIVREMAQHLWTSGCEGWLCSSTIDFPAENGAAGIDVGRMLEDAATLAQHATHQQAGERDLRDAAAGAVGLIVKLHNTMLEAGAFEEGGDGDELEIRCTLDVVLAACQRSVRRDVFRNEQWTLNAEMGQEWVFQISLKSG